ncbi:MAG: AAA family ATPase [Actinomycetota bacterium]|nr:AAA family ATPase [Actinomycetota bacterium]
MADCWTLRPDPAAPSGWQIDYVWPVPPPPPFTTVAWRLVHIANGVWIRWEHALGPAQRTFLDLHVPSTARRLLMLDEPTNGLDPQGTREVRTLIKDLADTGATVLLSTHLLAEVEQICTHVGVMHRGRLVAQSSLSALRASTAPTVFVDTDRPALAQGVFDRLGLREVAPSSGGVAALLGPADPAAIAAALVRDGVPIRGFGVREADLEELFVGLTGEGFDVSG